MKIKIKLTRKVNLDHYNVPKNTVVEIDFENEYMPICVGSEIYEDNSRTPMEAKKAQAVAARTFALSFINAGITIDDTITYQAFSWKDMSKYPNAYNAATSTREQVLVCNGEIIRAWYASSNGGHTRRSDEAWSSYKPWTVSKPDLWDVEARKKWGEVPSQHGVGMSQYGAAYAGSIGVNYIDILKFYYVNSEIIDQYGKGNIIKGEGNELVKKPDMGVLIMTNNDCYTKGREFVPQGIVVHSTGANNPWLKRYVNPDDGVLGKNQYNNHWNKPNFAKCGNGFIGKADNGEVMIYQTLPWNWRPWLCGKGVNGTFNDTHIQFEMCEDGLTNETYWREVRAKAVHLCAWLCQEYNMEVSNIVGHFEAARLGMANNHGDPQNWMRVFGDSMDKFRYDVALMLNGGEAPVSDHYIGKVKTRTGSGISIWSTPTKDTKLNPNNPVRDGEKIEVIGNNVMGTMAPCKYKNFAVAYVDSLYLVDREYFTEEPPVDPEPEPDPDPTPEVPEGYIVVERASVERLIEDVTALLNDGPTDAS